MSEDEDWAQLKEPWERVRWARSRVFETAEAAAAAVHMRGGTYRLYERQPGASSKTATLTFDKAILFARRFKVRWEWLLQGAGVPYRSVSDLQQRTPLDRVISAFEAVPEGERERMADSIEGLLRAFTRPAMLQAAEPDAEPFEGPPRRAGGQ